MKSLECELTELEAHCQALVEELIDVEADRVEAIQKYNDLKAQTKDCVATALDEAARVAEMEGQRLLKPEEDFDDARRIALKIRQLKRKL